MIEIITKFIGNHPYLTITVLGLLVLGYKLIKGNEEIDEDV